MAIKFLITADRFAEACTTLEYIVLQKGNKKAALACLPRFLVNDAGEYEVAVTLDADGDPQYSDAGVLHKILKTINPKRLERLETELCEAARSVVNPTNGTG